MAAEAKQEAEVIKSQGFYGLFSAMPFSDSRVPLLTGPDAMQRLYELTPASDAFGWQELDRITSGVSARDYTILQTDLPVIGKTRLELRPLISADGWVQFGMTYVCEHRFSVSPLPNFEEYARFLMSMPKERLRTELLDMFRKSFARQDIRRDGRLLLVREKDAADAVAAVIAGFERDYPEAVSRERLWVYDGMRNTELWTINGQEYAKHKKSIPHLDEETVNGLNGKVVSARHFAFYPKSLSSFMPYPLPAHTIIKKFPIFVVREMSIEAPRYTEAVDGTLKRGSAPNVVAPVAMELVGVAKERDEAIAIADKGIASENCGLDAIVASDRLVKFGMEMYACATQLIEQAEKQSFTGAMMFR